MSTESKPTILKSLTVNDFKELHNVARIQVVLNPVNDKLFIVGDGKTLGAVSKNYKSNEDKEFILMKFDDGSEIWCLHNISSNVQEEM